MEICLILAICQFCQFLQYLKISGKFNNFRKFGNFSNLSIWIILGVRRNNISNFLRGHSLKRIFRLVWTFKSLIFRGGLLNTKCVGSALATPWTFLWFISYSKPYGWDCSIKEQRIPNKVPIGLSSKKVPAHFSSQFHAPDWHDLTSNSWSVT